MAVLSAHFPLIPWSVVLAGGFLAALCDVRSHRIPNALTFPMLLAGMGYGILAGGLHGLAYGVLGCLALALPYILLFLLAGGGAGDAKMMGAIGMWLGLASAIPVLLAVAAIGAAMSIAYALLKRRARTMAANLRQMLFGVGIWTINGGSMAEARALLPEKKEMLAMPYGLAIFLGSSAAAAWTMIWTR